MPTPLPTRLRRPGGVRQLLAGQALVVAMVAGYCLTGPLLPDHGLQQLDLPSLHERVAGLPGTGRPQLVAAAGLGPACAARIRQAWRLRGRPGGLPASQDLTVLVEDSHPYPGLPLTLAPLTLAPLTFAPLTLAPLTMGGVRLIADPGGALARALALPAAATGCHPGYAILDPAGFVRYRSYDDGWAHHGSEQTVLLGSLR